MNRKYEVAAYYFPNYHQYKRNKKWYGLNWTEWKIVKRSEQRFDGHVQPKVPLWGYEDVLSINTMGADKKLAQT